LVKVWELHISMKFSLLQCYEVKWIFLPMKNGFIWGGILWNSGNSGSWPCSQMLNFLTRLFKEWMLHVFSHLSIIQHYELTWIFVWTEHHDRWVVILWKIGLIPGVELNARHASSKFVLGWDLHVSMKFQLIHHEELKWMFLQKWW
jgi:hypothetical protein